MSVSLYERLGCEAQIFAFSHCRDVVAAVSRAGGFGVLGASTFSPDELETELKWLDANTNGAPYGIDTIFPTSYDKSAETSTSRLDTLIPDEHWAFVDRVLDEADVPQLPPDVAENVKDDLARGRGGMTPAGARRLVEVALAHPQVKMLVSALGVPPADLSERVKSADIVLGALCGKGRHAQRQLDAGVEVFIAQGTEAGGHTGEISTLVLVPEVVDIVGSNGYVLAAGGITRGSQIAAALAMGAQGVWLGTVWLGTVESELDDFERQVLFSTDSDATVRSTARTGKPVRMIKSKLSDAFSGPDSPGVLPTPLQGILYNYAHARAVRAKRRDFYSFPVGQSVGEVRRETTVAAVMHRLQEELVDSIEHMAEYS